MPDNKPTDSEIVKALKKEIHLAEYVDSDYCSNTEVSLLKSTIDLINRLQAENERLNFLLNDAYENNRGLVELLERAKAEAYKDFAGKLKAIISIHKGDICKSDYTYSYINNLLKELVGDNNG